MIFKSMWIWKPSGTLILCLMTTYFELFYTFKVLAKRQGFLVQWLHVSVRYSLMFPFSLWVFILFFSFLTWFFLSFLLLFFKESFLTLILSLAVFVCFFRLYFTGPSTVPGVFPFFLFSLCSSFVHSAFLDFCCLRKPFQPFISYLLSYLSL